MGIGGGGSYCFDVEAFAQDGFQVATFLEDCRTRSPMETIHQDLKAFQTVLENQLISIINEDYAEFLQLSSKLKGVDEAVSSVRSPLLAILNRVDQVDQVIQNLNKRIHGAIQHDAELQKARKDLELSIRISEKLLLLEQLLEISSFEGDDEELLYTGADTADDDNDDDGFDNFEAVKQAEREQSMDEGCATLERATQMLLRLDLDFLEGVDILSVQREEKRLAVVEETLLRRLETEFATEVFPDTFYNRDHAINASTLSYLLRSYVLLQKSSIPEDMIARLLVQPFAEESITRGKLDGRVRGSCEGLQQVYDDILEFVSTKFGAILELPVCQGEAKVSVDLLGNAIWTPLYDVLSTKHAVIFKSSDADRFHHNYSISMKFIEKMEEFCGSEAMRQRFRSHESVVEFKEKWNMDVYFQLRFNQLAAVVEKAFDEKKPATQETPRVGAGQLVFPSSRRTWEVMNLCWDESVFLGPLLPEFTKLCVQLLVHYAATWRKPVSEAVTQMQGQPKPNFGLVHLACLESEDDVHYAGNDFKILTDKIKTELFGVVVKRVVHLVENPQEFVEDLFDETLGALSELEKSCWAAAASAIIEECKKVLPALRTVKGQYQMTNKPPPTTASSYVSNIVRPLEEFLDRWGFHFEGDEKQDMVVSVLDPVCEQYHSIASEILKSAQELEDSLKSRKMQRNASLGGGAGDGMSDTRKMRIQLRLDLDELHQLVTRMGVSLDSSTSFQQCKSGLSTDDE